MSETEYEPENGNGNDVEPEPLPKLDGKAMFVTLIGDIGMSPAMAIDFVAVTEWGFTQDEWAKHVRGVQNVRSNIHSAKAKLREANVKIEGESEGGEQE